MPRQIPILGFRALFSSNAPAVRRSVNVSCLYIARRGCRGLLHAGLVVPRRPADKNHLPEIWEPSMNCPLQTNIRTFLRPRFGPPIDVTGHGFSFLEAAVVGAVCAGHSISCYPPFPFVKHHHGVSKARMLCQGNA